MPLLTPIFASTTSITHNSVGTGTEDPNHGVFVSKKQSYSLGIVNKGNATNVLRVSRRSLTRVSLANIHGDWLWDRDKTWGFGLCVLECKKS
jgi:hypothetical protein